VGVRPQDIIDRNSTQEGHFLGEKNSEDGQELRCIIMDMSALSYIDSSSVHVLHLIVEEFAEVNIEFYFAGCSSPIFEMIMKYDIYVYDALTLKIFATVQDAVTFFQTEVIPR
jgi:anti-anti-sigma regulatory factor